MSHFIPEANIIGVPDAGNVQIFKIVKNDWKYPTTPDVVLSARNIADEQHFCKIFAFDNATGATTFVIGELYINGYGFRKRKWES